MDDDGKCWLTIVGSAGGIMKGGGGVGQLRALSFWPGAFRFLASVLKKHARPYPA